MAKYLTKEQLESQLIIGKAVEQWLSHDNKENYTILKWLRIDQEKDLTYSVAYFESFDEGNEGFLDVYEFSLLDPDEPFGIVNNFNSVTDALHYSVENYNARESKFVPAGMIQDEYKVYLESRK